MTKEKVTTIVGLKNVKIGLILQIIFNFLNRYYFNDLNNEFVVCNNHESQNVVLAFYYVQESN